MKEQTKPHTKVITGVTDHLISVKFHCNNLGQQFIKVSTHDLNDSETDRVKTISVPWNYEKEFGGNCRDILNRLELNYLACNTRQPNVEVYLFSWDYDTLKKNFNKSTLSGVNK